MRPRANITIEIQSTRQSNYDALNEMPLSEMDSRGAEYIELEFLSKIVDMFGESLDSLKVTANHTLVADTEVAA